MMFNFHIHVLPGHKMSTLTVYYVYKKGGIYHGQIYLQDQEQ